MKHHRLWLLCLALLGPIGVAMIAGSTVPPPAAACQSSTTGPASASGVPQNLIPIYEQAAAKYQLGPDGWSYLAAINKIETDFGHNLSVSSAGALGWMQFEPGTWQQWGVSADPAKPHTPPDPYDPWDAIFAAARYLQASGAPANWHTAIFAYNHADWYVNEVTSNAVSFAKAGKGQGTVPLGTPVSCTTTAYTNGKDPIPGFTASRDDMGVDACGKPGMPIYAPAASQLVEIIPNWWPGPSGPQPLLLFKFTPPLQGTLDGDQYWFLAEQVAPATTQTPTSFAAGQQVATFAPSGTCVELGWGSPTSNSRTLAGQMGDTAAAHPPRGALTQWGETFKKYFSIPWVGQSP